MSNVSITYNASEKRFLMPYTYTTKRKVVKNVNPRPKSFSALATQVLRAQGRGQTAISWQSPVSNPVLTIEGSTTECYLYRYENGSTIAITTGTFVDVLRYVGMVAKNGTEEHKTVIKTMQVNINVS
jgi:hypothetical protein